MIIRSIRLYNFGVYFGEQTITPIAGDHDQKVITLIGGMNGGGKTSLLDAILLALYGSRSISFRNSGNSYSDYLESLINKDTSIADGAAVEIDLEVPNETETTNLKIKRSWKLANILVTDRLEVWHDDEPDFYLAETWDSYVEHLLPSAISGLFFFDGEKISSLAEAEETPDNIQEAILTMLGLDLVERLILDLGTVIRRNKSKIKKNQVQKKFCELQEKKEQLDLAQQLIEQDLAKAHVDLARTNEQLNQKKEIYLHSGGPIAALRNQMQNDFYSLQEQYVQIKADLINLAAGPLPLLLLKPGLTKIAQLAFIDQKTKEAKSALDLLINRNRKIRTILLDLPRNSEIFAGIEEVLATQEEELQNLAGIESPYSLSPLAMAQLNELLTHMNAELVNRAKNLLASLNENELQQENLSHHLQAQINLDTISDILKEITMLSESKAKIEQRYEELENKRASIDYALRLIDGELKRVTAELTGMYESERIIQYAIKSRETMKLFKKRVTQSKIKKLAEEIKEAFLFLTHKSDLIGNIFIDPDSLRINLQDKQGRKIIKARLSSGERQMLAISILWGLAKSSGKKLPVIIDTPMGRLDSSHRMNFAIRYLPNASHQVIVLSTDTEIIGPYLSELGPYIGRRYLLNFNEEVQQTTIEKGYFAEPKRSVLS
jgi:DNA sulfur modification protein DndD